MQELKNVISFYKDNFFLYESRYTVNLCITYYIIWLLDFLNKTNNI